MNRTKAVIDQIVAWNIMKAIKNVFEVVALAPRKRSPNIVASGTVEVIATSTVSAIQTHSLQPHRNKHLDVIRVITPAPKGMKEKVSDMLIIEASNTLISRMPYLRIRAEIRSRADVREKRHASATIYLYGTGEENDVRITCETVRWTKPSNASNASARLAEIDT